MTATQIISAAYADVFGIAVSPSGCYWGQALDNGLTEIDYAMFDEDIGNEAFDIESDAIIAFTEDGCEGTWINVCLVRRDKVTRRKRFDRIGTIKTLDEGQDAWEAMGALAGALTYCAQEAAWRLYKAERAK